MTPVEFHSPFVLLEGVFDLCQLTFVRSLEGLMMFPFDFLATKLTGEPSELDQFGAFRPPPPHLFLSIVR